LKALLRKLDRLHPFKGRCEAARWGRVSASPRTPRPAVPRSDPASSGSRKSGRKRFGRAIVAASDTDGIVKLNPEIGIIPVIGNRSILRQLNRFDGYLLRGRYSQYLNGRTG
jgi:hypothetical protein